MTVYTAANLQNEVKKRRGDACLRKRVEEYVGEIPEVFQELPRAVLARHVATPNMESIRFAEMVQHIGLQPLWWQYSTDRFVTKAKRCKVSLGKIQILNGETTLEKNISEIEAMMRENRNMAVKTIRIIDLRVAEGKPINQILTKDGENLVLRHTRAFRKIFPDAEVWEATEWMKRFGEKAKDYYSYFLALFICHGVLLENFLMDEEEKDFTVNTVLPTIEKLQRLFGVKPLISPLLPLESEESDIWHSYPSHLLEDLAPNINGHAL